MRSGFCSQRPKNTVAPAATRSPYSIDAEPILEIVCYSFSSATCGKVSQNGHSSVVLMVDQREERVLMAKRTAHPGARKNLLKATLTRFAGSRGSELRAPGGSWRKILAQKLVPASIAAIPDPVSLAVFAIDRVGPAAVRACASGVEVRIAAPDEAIAEVLRAALAETARRRTTDQLIRIVVD